jgi:KaiC/GvpD/RAD55 family RecA-like ATPase
MTTDYHSKNLVSYKSQVDKLNAIRRGEIQEGLSLGVESIDEYWRFKFNSFNIVLGHASTGKTTTLLYLLLLYALKYDLKFLIYSAENEATSISKKLVEFLTGMPFHKIDDKLWLEKLKWVDKHFKYINIDEVYTSNELLEKASSIKKTYDYAALMIDPYNSLLRDKETMKSHGAHEYDYAVMSEMRLFTRRNKCSIYLVTHAVTEALRHRHPANHQFAGYITPPSAGSAEGGGKFLNKSDNFLILHRYTNHPELWTHTFIAVIKIKEIDSGGRPTPLDYPITLKSIANNVGFSLNGKNLLHLIKKR